MVEYNNPYKQKVNNAPRSEVIKARSENEAKEQFTSMMHGDNEMGLRWYQAESETYNSYKLLSTNVDSVFVK